MCDVTTEELKLLIQICQMECIPAESVNHAAINFYLRYEIYGRKLPDFTASIQFLSSLLTGRTIFNLVAIEKFYEKIQADQPPDCRVDLGPGSRVKQTDLMKVGTFCLSAFRFQQGWTRCISVRGHFTSN